MRRWTRPLCAAWVCLALAAGVTHAQAPQPARERTPAPATAATPRDAICPEQPALPIDLEARAQLEHAAIDRGFLYQLDKGGRRSYVFGTMHVGTPESFFPGPKTRAAFEASGVLAMEIDAEDPATLNSLAPLLMGNQPRVRVSSAQAQTLTGLLQTACLPDAIKQIFDQTHPSFRLIHLMVGEAAREGYFTDFGSETHLSARARATGRPVVALEKATDQFRSLVGSTRAQAQSYFDAGLLRLAQGDEGGAAARMSQAWMTSDHEAMTRFESWCRCMDTPVDRAAMKALNDNRNPGMARGIARLHQRQSVFAAIGALHLFGPRSLPSALQKLGFTVTRLHPAP